MNTSRIALIVLVLFAALFALGVGAGVRRNEEGPDPGKMDGDQIKAFVETSVPNFFKSLQSSWGSHGVKLKAQDFTYPKFKDPAVLINVSAKEPLIALLGKSSDETRKALFKLTAGAKASIIYNPRSLPEGGGDANARTELSGRKLELLPSAGPTGDCGKDDKSCVEISIFKDGGNLTFECVGDQPCRIELK